MPVNNNTVPYDERLKATVSKKVFLKLLVFKSIYKTYFDESEDNGEDNENKETKAQT